MRRCAAPSPSPRAFVDGLPVGATVSVGAASDVGVAGDLNALFRRADAALYVAKRAGRNRVELLGPDDVNPPAEVEAAVRSARRKSSVDLADPSGHQVKSLTSKRAHAAR